MVANDKQQKLMKRALRDLRNSAEDKGKPVMREYDANTIRKCLRSPKEGLGGVPIYLEGIGASHIAPGQHLVLSGDSLGWCLLDEAVAWNHLAYCILPVGLLSAPEYVAYAHSLGEDAIADDIAVRVAARYAGRPQEAQWQHYPFASFVFQLRRRWRNLSADPEVTLKQGPLSELLNRVFERDVVQQLLAVCDWHLVEANAAEDGKINRYDLYPMEILWVQRIRAERGLPNPELDHPLMKTPLAHPPPPEQRPRWDRQDPLYQEVRQRMIKEDMLPVDAP